MADALCILMGALDIIAGIIILILLFNTPIAMVFGVVMILKGAMSLGFF